MVIEIVIETLNCDKGNFFTKQAFKLYIQFDIKMTGRKCVKVISSYDEGIVGNSFSIFCDPV